MESKTSRSLGLSEVTPPGDADEAKLAKFREVRDLIDKRIKEWPAEQKTADQSTGDSSTGASSRLCIIEGQSPAFAESIRS
jgi:hypothetical protein